MLKLKLQQIALVSTLLTAAHQHFSIEAVEDTLDTTETNPQRLQEYASTIRQLWSMLAP